MLPRQYHDKSMTVQDCSISIANALGIPQSCIKPLNNAVAIGVVRHGNVDLTHCGLVTPYGGRDLGQLWLK